VVSLLIIYDSGLWCFNVRRYLIYILLLFTILSLLLFNDVYSDMMFIPTTIMNIKEPAQVAVIAWNGDVEVMFFGVNIEAVKSIKGIGLMPLPSKPEIYLGSNKSFEVIDKLLGGIVTLGVSTSVEYNVVLGPHNVTCIKIEGCTSKEEVKNVLMKIALENGLGELAINDTHASLIKYYVSIGYKYFLVDIINAENYTSGFLPPLIVKFRSKKIWYPLRISSLYRGITQLRILVVTPRKFYGGQWVRWHIKHTTIVGRDIIKKIDYRLLSVFSSFDLWFRVYVYGLVTFSANLDFDFAGYVYGPNLNLIYYEVLFFLIATIVSIGIIPNIKCGLKKEIIRKLKIVLLLIVHVAMLLGLGVLLVKGDLFIGILKYIDEEYLVAIIYVYSLAVTNIVLTVTLGLLLYRLIGFIRTKDLEYLTKKHISYLVLTLYILIILLSIVAMGKLHMDLYGPYYPTLLVQAIMMLVLIYVSIVLVANMLFQRRK